MSTAGIALLEQNERTSSFALWGFAAGMVLAAHVGLVAAYNLLHWPEPSSSVQSPAIMVELAPLAVAPTSQNDVAPGPEMMESPEVAQEPAPQQEPVPEIEPPRPVETPAEVTLPKAEPKPVEAKPVVRPQEKSREVVREQRRKPAPRTTAPQRSEQRPAPVARAPSPGAGNAIAAMSSWRDQLMAHLQRHKRYPSDAQARGEQGTVSLAFSMDRNGRLLARRIARSSGVASLDAEALAMIQRAQPLPPFPDSMTQSRIDLVVPIRFAQR
jgi:protein TonB